MKYAASMRYGGELIEASECDYQDFEYLKPLCPNCKEPVLLKSGSDRTSKLGKEFKIPPHWCHFSTKDPTLAQQCESRVSQYAKEEIERRAAHARGQRLKLFQRWFWTIVSRLPMAQNQDETLGQILELHWDLYTKNPRYSSYSDQITEVTVMALKKSDTIKQRIAEVLRQFIDGDFDFYGKKKGDEVPLHLQQYLDRLNTTVDMRLQCQIAFEALGFLCSSRGVQFLRAFNFNALIPYIEKDLPKISPEFLRICVDNAIIIVALVPWSSEFEQAQKR